MTHCGAIVSHWESLWSLSLLIPGTKYDLYVKSHLNLLHKWMGEVISQMMSWVMSYWWRLYLLDLLMFLSHMILF